MHSIYDFQIYISLSISQKRRRSDKNQLGQSSRASESDENCENRMPLRAVEYLDEMGLGVLDTDESTSSSAISNGSHNTLTNSQPSSVPPASALSLAISDNFGLLEDSDSNENDHTIVPGRGVDDGDVDDNFDMGHHGSQSDILSDFLLSDSNDSSDVSLKKITTGEHLQDNTPANLVPLSRTTFGTLVEHSTSSSCSSGSTLKVYGQPMMPTEGRAIRNTSLVKFSTTNSMQKHKGRSPLATVTCHNIHNNSIRTCAIDAKKMLDDANFFMHQKEDPRIYKGEGM